MISFCRYLIKISMIVFLVNQTANASPLGLCPCSSCGCGCCPPKENFYNTLLNSLCSSTDYQNYQNTQMYPNNRCYGQNMDPNYQTCDTGSPCNCDGCSYDLQIPCNCPPTPRYSYSYTVDTPPASCPPTFKNFNYQLQTPCRPVDGFMDKTYRTYPYSCKSLC